MATKKKREDAVQAARRVVDEAIGERPKTPPPRIETLAELLEKARHDRETYEYIRGMVTRRAGCKHDNVELVDIFGMGIAFAHFCTNCFKEMPSAERES